MSRHSHPAKHTPEQVLHVKRLRSTAKRTCADRLGHKEPVRIEGETGVSRYIITMIANGTYCPWLWEPAK